MKKLLKEEYYEDYYKETIKGDYYKKTIIERLL